jgi:hypothetical protein
MELKAKILELQRELDINSINKQRKRYLESYLSELIAYSEKYPNKTELPSTLVLYCESNPDASECRIFDV